MKRLGLHNNSLQSSAPIAVVILYSTTTNLPVIAWIQESTSDAVRILINGVFVDCLGILDTVEIQSVRPQSQGGMRRITADISFKTNTSAGTPFIEQPIAPQFYYGGRNFDDFYFAIYSIDRLHVAKDIRLGAMYGVFKVDNELNWAEKDGTQSMQLIDILLAQENICGASTETIPDMFFAYNSWYDNNFIPKAYGQVPRVRVLNAFPSFSIKDFAAGITGRVLSTYTNASTTILLEDNVDKSSLLLQTANLNGKVRIRMGDNEVIYGTIAYDSMAKTITLTVVTRNTYYNQVQAYNDSLDGRSPNQWGPNPNWTDVRFSPYQTVIPDAKKTILDPNGYMQADIAFFRIGEVSKGEVVTNVSTKMNGLLDERKDIVVHEYWEDPDFTGKISQGSVSGVYTSTNNATYLPTDHSPLWPIAAFQFLKFNDETVPVRLFFNNPATSVAGSGAIGSSWQLVSIENATVDNSCYIRNGFSKFETTRVYCEGEGKLIAIPSANVTITQSGTFHGLTNMAKFALTAAPLDMNIGAKTNNVYVDCLYKTDTALDNRSERILEKIITQEAPSLVKFLGPSISNATPGYPTDNFLPYMGWVCKDVMTATQIIDKICYQLGFTFRWDYGRFEIELTGRVFNNLRDVTIDAVIHKQPIALSTDANEMLENSATISIGKLKTAKYSTNYEYIPLYYIATYGGWQDPFYEPVRSQSNRTVKPDDRVVEYHFDLINDSTSFTTAVASSLASCHPSGYCLTQRRLVTDMTMNGCRWEPMVPIVMENFPGISIVGDTNIVYAPDGGIAWIKEPVSDRPYILGASCNVESVTYSFDISDPKVTLVAKVAQSFVQATGISIYGPPAGIPLVPTIPTDPNSPPNTKPPGVTGGGTWGVGGNDYPMPLIVSEVPSILIDDVITYTSDFTITVDDGWVYNLGCSYTAYIQDIYAPGEVSTLATGADLIGDVSGSFDDKLNDAYVPVVKDLTLRVNYLWLSHSASDSRPLSIIIDRAYRISRNADAPIEFDTVVKQVTIRRKQLPGVVGS